MPGAVTCERVGADGAAMLEIAQHGERVGDDAVRLLALEVGDEADAAGIAFIRGVEETLSLGALDAAVCGMLRHASSSVPSGKTKTASGSEGGLSAGSLAS